MDWIEYLVNQSSMEAMMALSLIGTWLLARHSERGFVLATVHFISFLVFFSASSLFVSSWSVELALALWVFWVLPGASSVLYFGVPKLYDKSKMLWGHMRWYRRWLFERSRQRKGLVAMAKNLDQAAVKKRRRLLWKLEHHAYVEIAYRLESGSGWTHFTYASGGHIPLTLDVSPLPKTKALTSGAALLDEARGISDSWLNTFVIESHWRPFHSLRLNAPRSFGQVVPGYTGSGYELDLLGHLRTDARSLIASLPEGAELWIRDGEVRLRHRGFLYDDELIAMADRIKELGDALSAPLGDGAYPVLLLDHLQRESVELVQIRLLEFLLGRYGDAPEAMEARAWALARDVPIFHLLVGVFDGPEGHDALRVLALRPAKAETKGEVIRRAALEHLWSSMSPIDARALVAELLQSPNDPLCAYGAVYLASAYKDDGIAAGEKAAILAISLEWLANQEAPYSKRVGDALLALYRAAPQEETEIGVIGLLKQPSLGLAMAALDAIAKLGSNETMGRLHRFIVSLAGEDSATLATRKQVQQAMERLRAQLGPQELGQLSMIEVEEGEGKVSLATNAEADGGLSLASPQGGGEVTLLPQEGGATVVVEDDSP